MPHQKSKPAKSNGRTMEELHSTAERVAASAKMIIHQMNDLASQIQEEKAQKRRQATQFTTGDKVRFIGGLFSGKTGVVQGFDTKAQVKVLVGKMSVVVPGTDLAPAP